MDEYTQWRRGSGVWLVWFTCWTGDLREGESLFLQQETRIELWNKVIPGVSLFNLKSAHADSEQVKFQWQRNALRGFSEHQGGLSQMAKNRKCW